jgi:uncharacterized lipoprotein YbaY
MTEEGPEKVELEEPMAQEEPEMVSVEDSEPWEQPAEEKKTAWAPVVIAIVAVVLALCACVVCIATAIAVFSGGKEEASVSGTVTYRERMALTPDAFVTVQIQDVSLADAPASTIGEQVIRNPGQVPIPFEVG